MKNYKNWLQCVLPSILFLLLNSLSVLGQCPDPSPYGDCDQDGVMNIDDLDDDNDGILDTDEGFQEPTPQVVNNLIYGNGYVQNLLTVNRNCLGVFTADLTYTHGSGTNAQLTAQNGGDDLRIRYGAGSGQGNLEYNFSEPVDVVLRLRGNHNSERVSFLTMYDNIIPGGGSTVNGNQWHNNNSQSISTFEFFGVDQIRLVVRGNTLNQFQSIGITYLDMASCQNTDGDGLYDHHDLDSDDDGCLDVIEAVYWDPELDGILGSPPLVVDVLNGQVIGTNVINGYTGTTVDVTDGNINDCIIILPVEWCSFDVKYGDNCSHLLKWKTCTEQNSDFFELERSLDGVSWNTIGTVKATGNSSSEIEYSFLTERLESLKTIYYRVVEVDTEANRSVSEVKSIESQGCQSNLVFTSLSDVRSIHTSFEVALLYDSQGRMVKTITKNDDLRLIESTLSNGSYYITIDGQSQYRYIKVGL